MKAISLLALAAAASAQQSAWGQCGGIGYSGQTTCVSGYICTKLNDWYSQCIPGTASTTSTTTSVTSQTKSTSTTLTTSTRTSSTSSSTVVPTGSISKTNGLKFTIDGTTKYFAGTNSYWIGFLDSSTDVDLTLDVLKNSGLKILRVWGFNDVTSNNTNVYFQLFSGGKATINTGANGLQKLDYVVKSAEQRGIKLIINFVNYWNDYGGMAAYRTVCGGASNAEWYNRTSCQDIYKNYIKTVVNRYIDSPAVFAWELANEPRCQGCNTDIVYNWVKTTSAYIKSLDSKHMVTIGDEGFGIAGDTSYPYQYGEGLDFAKNLNISTIDFGTFHMYPESWGVSPSTFPSGWIQAHGAACVAAGKPCLFEEYGITSNHCTNESPWQDTSLKTDGVAGDLFWQLGVTLSSGQQTHNDGNTVYNGTSDWTCLVTNHVKAIG